MDSVANENRPRLQCRIRLTVEDEAGEEVAIDLEETLDGSPDRADALRLRNRIIDALENRLVPRFRKNIWDWAESRLPAQSETFEDEFARRCDRNDDVIDALECLSPHIPSDEERDWQDRMVEVLMARQENEMAR